MPQAKYFTERSDWRQWLEEHFTTAPEIWLAYPKKASGKPRILYNDAVEEALCFGWIDSTVKSLDAMTSMQRFTPRRKGSAYSQANKERLQWLYEQQLIHPSLRAEIKEILALPFHYPEDILQTLRANPLAWQHYQHFPAAYCRIRIAYIDSARKRPEEFAKRLANFIKKTEANQLIKGYGGIDKYY